MLRLKVGSLRSSAVVRDDFSLMLLIGWRSSSLRRMTGTATTGERITAPRGEERVNISLEAREAT